MDAVPLAVAICVCEQGGPDSSAVKNMPYYNQWEDLDDSPIGWHITEVGASVMNLRGSQCTWHPYRKAPCHVRRDRRILSCYPAKRLLANLPCNNERAVPCAARGSLLHRQMACGHRRRHLLSCDAVVSCVAKRLHGWVQLFVNRCRGLDS